MNVLIGLALSNVILSPSQTDTTDKSELYVFLAFDKVGSTSIRHQIINSIRKKRVCDPYFDGDICFSDVSNHYVNANAMNKSKFREYQLKCESFGRRCVFYTILRDPITRIFSAYSYFCKDCAEQNRQCNVFFGCPHTDILSYASKFGNIYTNFFSDESFVSNTKFMILDDPRTYHILNDVGLNNNLATSNDHAHTNEFCDDCVHALSDLLRPDIDFYTRIISSTSSSPSSSPSPPPTSNEPPPTRHHSLPSPRRHPSPSPPPPPRRHPSPSPPPPSVTTFVQSSNCERSNNKKFPTFTGITFPSHTQVALVLSMPRSGSNWVDELLDQHPQIKAYGESFHPFMTSLNDVSISERDVDRSKYLNRLIGSATQSQTVVTIKIFPYHLSIHEFNHILDNPRVKKIVIQRLDVTSQALSMVNAESAKEYNKPHHDIKFVSREKVESVRSEQRYWYSCLEEKLAMQDWFYFTYESLCNDSTKLMSNVFRFLNVDPFINHVSTHVKNDSPPPSTPPPSLPPLPPPPSLPPPTSPPPSPPPPSLSPPSPPPASPPLEYRLFFKDMEVVSLLITLVATMLWCGVMPTFLSSNVTSNVIRCKKSTVASFALLVLIAISKTVLTKHIFEHINAPVAMSALSCIVTGIMLVPVCIANGTLRLLTMEESKTLALVCTTVAADLAFTNVGLSILPIAFQQAIKSALPVATVAVEFLLYRKCVSHTLLAMIVGICLGPITMALDKSWSADSSLVYGVTMLSLSIVAGALKYVLAHSAMTHFKQTMGTIGFTFWIEVFATVFILPWSVANGEVAVLMEHASSWMLLVGTAAFGGVRILAQFFFLEKTSPTTLAASNIVIQIALTAAGALIFQNAITMSLICGTLITLVMSASYTYVKSVAPIYAVDDENTKEVCEEERLVPNATTDAQECQVSDEHYLTKQNERE